MADSVWNDSDWHREILEEPEVGGRAARPDAIVIRLVVKTKPAEQFTVMRELRRRLLEAFAAEGVELPDPGRGLVEREAGTSQESEPTPE